MAKDTPTPDTAAQAASQGEPISAAELEQLRLKAAERDEYLDLAQRARAEFDNYQKRVQRDREQDRKYAFGPIAAELLPILDNLERALDAAQQAGEQGPLMQGVAMVQGQYLELLRRHGVSRIEALGQPFDPHLHQAMLEQPTADAAPGTIVQVYEQGYLNQDRVLRPAKVIVARKP